MPPDARERLECEVEHIQRIAEAEFERHKRQWEQDFLDDLRRTSIGPGEADRSHLQQKLCHILELIRAFCRCEYLVFFGSVQEGDTVLAPIAQAGVPSAIVGSLPHFNWKKARLPVGNFDVKEWDIAQWLHEARNRGIRGDNSDHFAKAGCIIPTSLGDRYRGVIILGPFAEQVDIQEERRFLIEMANTVGSLALGELQVLNLERERRRWRSTATLLTHQLRTALTPITALIGRAKALVQKSGKGVDVKRVSGFLSTTEDLTKQLSQRAKQTLAGHVVQLEREDLEFERYSLSVLVVNCAEGFVPEAKKRHRDLVVDKSVERLPEAEVDVARLTIALSNLIENAIKYSYPNTTIYIRADLHSVADPALAAAVIEVDDIGDEIQPEARERIFEEGTRGLTKAIIDAHGGEIGVLCKPTLIQRRQGTAYRVVFSVKVPLSQNDVRGRS
jgi:signal transduction histidine kinase